MSRNYGTVLGTVQVTRNENYGTNVWRKSTTATERILSNENMTHSSYFRGIPELLLNHKLCSICFERELTGESPYIFHGIEVLTSEAHSALMSVEKTYQSPLLQVCNSYCLNTVLSRIFPNPVDAVHCCLFRLECKIGLQYHLHNFCN